MALFEVSHIKAWRASSFSTTYHASVHQAFFHTISLVADIEVAGRFSKPYQAFECLLSKDNPHSVHLYRLFLPLFHGHCSMGNCTSWLVLLPLTPAAVFKHNAYISVAEY